MDPDADPEAQKHTDPSDPQHSLSTAEAKRWN
jgi:hypothetical protein